MGFYQRMMNTPGTPVVTLTETQFRQALSRYVRDVDRFVPTLVADTNWIIFPDVHLWQSVPGTFNPTTSTANPAGHKDSHRRGDDDRGVD